MKFVNDLCTICRRFMKFVMISVPSVDELHQGTKLHIAHSNPITMIISRTTYYVIQPKSRVKKQLSLSLSLLHFVYFSLVPTPAETKCKSRSLSLSLSLYSRPRWLSWMRRPTGDQEVAGSTPAEVGNILSWRLIMKYFLRSFSPFR